MIEQIQKMGHFAAGMEKFSASDAGQWEVISATIKQSDYYICILGHRYGWAKNKNSVSYTEREWDHAKSLGIPIMTFILKDDAPVDPTKLDNEAFKKEKLRKFKEKAKKGRLVEFWTTPSELCQQVIIAISNSFHTDPRPGWIRADSDNVAEQMASLVQENRQLRDENVSLKGLVRSRSPNFSVSFGASSIVSLEILRAEGIDPEKLPLPTRLDFGSLPAALRRHTNPQEIEDYNDNLPLIEDIKAAAVERASLAMMKQRLPMQWIKIINSGNCPANNIVIDLLFPDAVELMQCVDFVNYRPKGDFKETLTTLARRRAGISQNKRRHAILDDELEVTGDAYLELLESVSEATVHRLAVRNDVRINFAGNSMRISIESLMQTMTSNIGPFILLPKSCGTFDIHVSAICIELPSRIELKIALEVSEKRICL